MIKKINHYFLLFLLLAVQAAVSQQKGILEGRVINKSDPSIIVRSAELDLVELDAGMQIVKTVTTDAAGKYRIENLSAGGRMMLRVNYKEVNYHRLFSLEAAGKNTIDIEVYEPTASMKGITVEGAQMAFQMSGDQLKALETVTFNNKTNPPRTYMNPQGNFRSSKAAGILEPPEVRVTAPGSSMPVVQSALESPDGETYYSLYPLKPGVTTFEVQQVLPYSDRTYAFKKKFYQDIPGMNIGVIPKDMSLSGQGLSRLSTDAQQDFAVFKSGPIRAGEEVLWTLSGGTPVSAPPSGQEDDGSAIEPRPDAVSRNALAIGPLLLMGFVIVLWIAFNRYQQKPQSAAAQRAKEMKERREKLLDTIARLDHEYETNAIGRQEHSRQREEIKRKLRRISLIPKN
jgi:hypothetical protein